MRKKYFTFRSEHKSVHCSVQCGNFMICDEISRFYLVSVDFEAHKVLIFNDPSPKLVSAFHNVENILLHFR